MSRNSKEYINIVTLTYVLEMQGQTWHNALNMLSLGVYIEKLVFDVYNHQTEVMELEVSTIYTTRDIILNALRHVWPWFSKSKVKVTILIYLLEFRDIDLVLIDTKHTFLRYILPELYAFWMCYVLFDLECQSQNSRSRYWYNYIFLNSATSILYL